MPDLHAQSFKQDFSTYRQRHLLVAVKSSLQDGLSAAALSVLAIAVPARLLSPWLWLAIPLLFVTVSAVLLSRRWPDLKTSALSFDRLCHSNSAVTNFLELQASGRDDAFARCAMQRGLDLVQAYGKTVRPLPAPPARFLWSYWLAPLVVFLILVYPQSTESQVSADADSQEQLATSPATVSKALAPLRETRKWLKKIQSESSATGISQSQSTVAQRMLAMDASSGSAAGENASAVAASGAADNLSEAQASQNQNAPAAGNQAPQRPELNRAGKGSPSIAGQTDGNDNVSSDDTETDSEVSIAASTGVGLQTPSSRQNKPRRKNLRQPAAGDSIMPSDSLPTPSNEEGDGETGDDPGDGTGGENGQKKARGAAPMLPVVPEPDTVSGRLGNGVELTSIKPAPEPVTPEASPKNKPMTPGKEPVGIQDSLPEKLYLNLRNAD